MSILNDITAILMFIIFTQISRCILTDIAILSPNSLRHESNEDRKNAGNFVWIE